MHWLKIRESLATHPKVLAISRRLWSATDFRNWALCGDPYPDIRISDEVKRFTALHVTINVWSGARHHGEIVGEDLILPGLEIADLDVFAGSPGVGAAMESVGWARYDEVKHAVILPRFTSYNTSRSTMRVRRWREKNRQLIARSGNVSETFQERSRNALELELEDLSQRARRKGRANDGKKPNADAESIWETLSRPPWGFGRVKIEAVIDRGTTAADLAAWEAYALEHTRGAAVSAIQTYRHPRDIPPDPAAAGKRTRGPSRRSSFRGDDQC